MNFSLNVSGDLLSKLLMWPFLILVRTGHQDTCAKWVALSGEESHNLC